MPISPNTTGVPSRATSKLLQNASPKSKRHGRKHNRKSSRK